MKEYSSYGFFGERHGYAADTPLRAAATARRCANAIIDYAAIHCQPIRIR